MLMGGVRAESDTASTPGRPGLVDAGVDAFGNPFLDFRNVLLFVCDTLPAAQGTVHRDAMPRAADMPHLAPPPPLFLSIAPS